MARLIHFHIGLPKTGTTFLQTMMWQNRPALRQQGLLYPGRLRMDHFNASQAVREVLEAPASAQQSWRRIVRQLARFDGAGLISHEFFCIATAEQATRAVEALAPADVRVLVTARDYVRQFPAVWQEALKIGLAGSLDEYMDRVLAHQQKGPWSWASQDLPAALERWSAAVGPENIHVVTVPAPGAQRDLLWQRWLEATGIDDSAFDKNVSLANESFGAAQAALMQRVQPHASGPLADGPTKHRWLRRYLGHEVLVPQAGERFGLEPRHAEQLRDLSLEAVEKIRSDGYHVIGDLDDLIPAADQPPRPHPDHITDAEIVDVASRAIEQMVRDVRQLTIERDRWRRRAKAARSPKEQAKQLARRGRDRLRSRSS